MCCEECPRYENCEANNKLKSNCCPLCPEYYDCAGIDTREEDYDRDNNEEYL